MVKIDPFNLYLFEGSKVRDKEDFIQQGEECESQGRNVFHVQYLTLVWKNKVYPVSFIPVKLEI